LKEAMPTVSIVVPCYNEQETISLLLDAIYCQTYSRAELEVVIADGMSTDETRARIHEFAQTHPDLLVRIVDNPKRTIPSGLNSAIGAAGGEFIVRLDAHSIPYPDYVTRCVAALKQGEGDNVGGVWEIQAGGSTWVAGAIAAAAAHPIGVGDARYRLGGEAQAVDTVPFGAFRKELAQRVGPFDESLLTNEDYEFNVRIRQAGGRVWFDPQIRSIYIARSSLRQLFAQYWRYGYWKGRMIRRYPHTLRWRQLLPPLFILGILSLALFSIWIPGFRWLFLIFTGIYVSILILAGILMAGQKRDGMLVIGLPLSIGCMHIAWGAAFLWSFLKRPAER
jgi:glycosyltransferase involved in cell wall biosynthesis